MASMHTFHCNVASSLLNKAETDHKGLSCPSRAPFLEVGVRDGRGTKERAHGQVAERPLPGSTTSFVESLKGSIVA